MTSHDLLAHYFLMLNNISCLDVLVYLSIHLLKGHLGCFQVLTVVNKAAINIHVQVFVSISVRWNEFSVHWVTRSMTAGLKGESMFSFVGNCQVVFQSSCTVFSFPPAVNERCCCFTPSPAFGVVSALDFDCSNKCAVGSCVVLIYNSLMTYGVEYLLHIADLLL